MGGDPEGGSWRKEVHDTSAEDGEDDAERVVS